MPSDRSYSLSDLADLADVTPRTVRYYIAQGLLASPSQAGPGTRYPAGHLARLRLIRQLQREHLPLAEIRSRLARLGDDDVAALLDQPPLFDVADSAVDYIRAVLAGGQGSRVASVVPGLAASAAAARAPAADAQAGLVPGAAPEAQVPGAQAPGAASAPTPALSARAAGAPAFAVPAQQASAPAPGSPPAAPDRSQWDRVLLAPDIELHVRRPLSRLQNRRVDRLIAIARELLEEDRP